MDQESFISVMDPGIGIREVFNDTDGNRVTLLERQEVLGNLTQF